MPPERVQAVVAVLRAAETGAPGVVQEAFAELAQSAPCGTLFKLLSASLPGVVVPQGGTARCWCARMWESRDPRQIVQVLARKPTCLLHHPQN